MSKDSTTSKDKKETPRWVAIAALIVAIVGAVITIYNFVIDNSPKKPEVQLTRPASLVIKYEPKDNIVEFSFDFSVENTGKADEIVTATSARLTNASKVFQDGINYIPFATDDILFKSEGSSSMKAPFSINRGTTRFTCTFAQKLGERSRQVIQNTDRLQLSLYLSGKDGKDYQLTLCFIIDPEKLKSRATEQQVFKNPTCD